MPPTQRSTSRKTVRRQLPSVRWHWATSRSPDILTSEQVRRYEPPGTCARAGLAANDSNTAAPAIAAALMPPIRLRMMSLLLSSVNMTNAAERGLCSHHLASGCGGAGTIAGEDANNDHAPSTGGAMPHPLTPDDRRAGSRSAILL